MNPALRLRHKQVGQRSHRQRGAQFAVHLPFAQHLFHLGFQTFVELVHAQTQAFGLAHQRVSGQQAAEAGVARGKTQDDPQNLVAARLHARFFLQHPVDQAEDRVLDKIDQAFEHARLAGEMPVQCRLGHAHGARQPGGGDALTRAFFQFRGQRFQNLLPA